MFERYVGVDYSGAETPDASLKGLRVYAATPQWGPVEVQPPPSPRKYWTRKEIAEWIVELTADGPGTLMGIDHGFSPQRRVADQLYPSLELWMREPRG